VSERRADEGRELMVEDGRELMVEDGRELTPDEVDCNCRVPSLFMIDVRGSSP
jgi:hypothetical protein